MEKLCNCGCGKAVNPGRKFVKCHHGRPKKYNKPEKCNCGCGNLVRPGSTWINGHNRKKKPRRPERSKICQCGCEELASPGSRFIQGHNTRSIKPKRPERCECGCGKAANSGRRFIKNHQNRNAASIARISATLKEGYASGRIVQWNTGGVAWNKGIGLEPLHSPMFHNPDFRVFIFELNGHKCNEQDCEHKSTVLHIHHIDYDRFNDNPANLIVLCNICHGVTSASSDRPYWTARYEGHLVSAL